MVCDSDGVEVLADNDNCALEYPLEFVRIDPKTEQQILDEFRGEREGHVLIGPKKYMYPLNFVKHAEKLYNFEAREDDIWINTFARSGTTWTQEMVWMIANDLNYARAQSELLTERSPFFEFCMFMNDQLTAEVLQANAGKQDNQDFVRRTATPAYDYMPEMPGPRVIKTHMPFSMLPPSVMQKRAKVVYVARNPKDVAVSFYHLSRLFRTIEFTGDFPKYWDYFEKGLVCYGPYWEHIKEGWQHRHDPNVLFMFYEDMNRDLPGAIRKVGQFLNKNMTDDQVAKLTNYLSIEQFRNNPWVNQHELKDVRICHSKEPSFVRSGKTSVNGWQKEYTPEIIDRAEKWIAEHLEHTDLRFPNVEL